jgi:hypothetical protein
MDQTRPRPCLVSNSSPNSTIKKEIPHHIKMSANAWSTKCRWNQKLIAQFCCTLRDGHFESNLSFFWTIFCTKKTKVAIVFRQEHCSNFCRFRPSKSGSKHGPTRMRGYKQVALSHTVTVSTHLHKKHTWPPACLAARSWWLLTTLGDDRWRRRGGWDYPLTDYLYGFMYIS